MKDVGEPTSWGNYTA